MQSTLVSGSLQHTRVLLADDHAVVRRGLRTILEATDEYEVCGEAADGNTTLDLALRLHPDIVITDISMAPTNGLEVTRCLRRLAPDLKVLILTMHDSAEMLRAAASAGASGYLLKSDAEELLILALETVHAGRRFVSPSFNSVLVKQIFA